MIVGGAALIIGLIIGGSAGLIVAIACGQAVGLYGLFLFLQVKGLCKAKTIIGMNGHLLSFP